MSIHGSNIPNILWKLYHRRAKSWRSNYFKLLCELTVPKNAYCYISTVTLPRQMSKFRARQTCSSKTHFYVSLPRAVSLMSRPRCDADLKLRVSSTSSLSKSCRLFTYKTLPALISVFNACITERLSRHDYKLCSN